MNHKTHATYIDGVSLNSKVCLLGTGTEVSEDGTPCKLIDNQESDAHLLPTALLVIRSVARRRLEILSGSV